jgi:hypothetical protein
VGPALVVVAVGWLWLAQTQIPDAGAEWPGPRGFPLLLGVVLAVLGTWLTVFPGAGATGDSGAQPHAESRRDAVVAGGTFGLLVLYAFLLERVGFLLAALVVMALTMIAVLRIRRWAFIAAFAALFALGCWLVFSTLLGIPLPRGTWIAW